jgi:hypothetical protein
LQTEAELFQQIVILIYLIRGRRLTFFIAFALVSMRSKRERGKIKKKRAQKSENVERGRKIREN